MTINASQIKNNAPVVCSNNKQFGVVDHMEGASSIKLNKDDKGQYHYIPLAWVKSVDDKVHVDRPGDQAMREWTTTASGNSTSSANAAPSAKAAPTGMPTAKQPSSAKPTSA